MLLRLSAARASVVLALAALGALGASARCAKTQCGVNSDCGPRRYCDLEQICRSDCAEDRDCADGYCDLNGRCQNGARDAGPDVASDDAPANDASSPDVPAPQDVFIPVDNPPPPPDVVTPVDNPPPPIDNPPPPPDIVTPVDNPPPTDLGPPPGGYLDPCMLPSDCASRDCAPGAGGARFCSRTCTSRRDCGDGYLCAIPAGMSTGRCLPDDTGAPCNISDNRCARYCYSTMGASVAHCTRECADGRDCPAGYACQPLGGGQPNVCVHIERPCNRGSDCATSVCLGGIAGTSFRGCSAMCRTAADCPPRAALDDGTGRLLVLPPYRCQTVDGVPVCVPPLDVLGGDIAGSDALGTSCNATPGAINQCRSGLCESQMSGGVCLQGCTVAGGCPPGYGCKPEVDTPMGLISLVCRPAGTGALGTTCARASDCASALCLPPPGGGTTGYCTRLCADGICPTSWRCEPQGRAADGSMVSICVR